MQTTNPTSHKAIGSILIPMNAVESGGAALAHALRIAVASKSSLRVLQLDQSSLEAAGTSLIASFRRTLELWGMRSVIRTDMDSGRVDSAQLDIVHCSDPNALKVLELATNSHDQEPSCRDGNRKQHSTDLIVLDAETQDGWMGQLLDLIRFANSRSPFQATLLVPSNASRFISQSNGVIRLTKILIPCISDPHPINALKFVSRLVECLDQRIGSFTLLYVGSPDATPNINPPRVDGWNWVIKTLPGSPAEKILQQAECMEADLIVLTIVSMDISDSPSNSSCLGPIPLDVMRKSRCPTLLVPTDYG